MSLMFPVYVISKGRWETPYTARALDAMGVPFQMIVEEREHGAYAEVVGEDRLLILPRAHLDHYDVVIDRDGDTGLGPGPARNFAMQHSLSSGHTAHWVLDDNIKGFQYMDRQAKVPAGDGAFFAIMEGFFGQWENLGACCPRHGVFSIPGQAGKPMSLNLVVYSCMLVNNDMGLEWRGRGVEDIDLSIRAWRANWATVVFNNLVQDKPGKNTTKGGNTSAIYDQRLWRSAREAYLMHPDVIRIRRGRNKFQSRIDYRRVPRPRLRPRRDRMAAPQWRFEDRDGVRFLAS